MERTFTRAKLAASLLATAFGLSALAAIGTVWAPQPGLNPFTTNGNAIGYFFALHFAGGLVAFIIALLLADRGGDSSPLTVAFLANLVPGCMGLAIVGFLGNWGTLAIWVGSVALAGTLTFWLILRPFGLGLQSEDLRQ
ncbi:hypothetical protein [Microbacterium sp. 77mftsu3.1]|uniref:hypothetical protein n=1 Tax=Microbacterium sp. 77mftsu3.1 TaxID=1761802 RepID=UPI000475FFD3|nr:hypothetical protein [Microbacterium sp. 77mftsu3.1]SDH53344.1 hypothetical protein SAMN04488590_3499 [Microbacterium sp. 77mftsu3.1]